MRGTILFTQYCKQKRVELGSTILVACTVYQSTGGSFSKCMNETTSTCTGAGIGTGSSNTAMRNVPVSGIYWYQESTCIRNLPIPGIYRYQESTGTTHGGSFSASTRMYGDHYSLSCNSNVSSHSICYTIKNNIICKTDESPCRYCRILFLTKDIAPND